MQVEQRNSHRVSTEQFSEANGLLYAALLNEIADGRLMQEDNRLAITFKIVCQSGERLYVGRFPFC